MMKNVALLVAIVAIFASCDKYKKTTSGTKYKVYEGNGAVIKPGEIMQIDISAKYKDSILFSTVQNGMPQFIPYDTAKLPADLKQVFTGVKVGDSIVLAISTDSLIKMGRADSIMKKGDFAYQSFKIVKVYANEKAADSAYQQLMVVAQEKQKAKDVEQVKVDETMIADYIKKNKINATRTENGVYVEIIKPGTGAFIDTNNVVKVFYTGKLFNGQQFDSNTDPTKGDALLVNLTSDYNLGMTVIPGWNEGLKKLNKGAVAKLYIPSGLAYGSRGQQPKIAPNSNLIFNIEIADVLNKTQAKVEADALRKKYEQMQH